MLCGISYGFPQLFPSRRQVAHVLLARPPLIAGRSLPPVRLECVMHAASVHPEPGSNSLISFIISKSCLPQIFFARSPYMPTLLDFAATLEFFPQAFRLRFCLVSQTTFCKVSCSGIDSEVHPTTFYRAVSFHLYQFPLSSLFSFQGSASTLFPCGFAPLNGQLFYYIILTPPLSRGFCDFFNFVKYAH